MKKIMLYVLLICAIVFVYPSAAQAQPQLVVTLNTLDQIGRIRFLFSDLQLDLNNDGQLSNTFNRFDDASLQFDYYDRFDTKEKQGKLKSIGTIQIDYYDSFDNETKRGKVKRIGDTTIDYYDQFDQEELQGKIKSIGGEAITYYDRFANEEIRGKLKSIGGTEVYYYDRFDGADKAGRIKAITKNGNGKIRIMVR
ncbi:hypothetical protein H8S90_05370 [Olivibacter sp. SDN3]|uniref:hypothetical protein n=1 Tax=Olivibacter sp. SDN3 TaxID=2764720 RepID=UPI0016516EBD|nr:hypothetical protein [Olivibacter sp. SDN3]QNL51021.1 hypothetical protein H8S90_05370 [Olivibacter sp. SDN3]